MDTYKVSTFKGVLAGSGIGALTLPEVCQAAIDMVDMRLKTCTEAEPTLRENYESFGDRRILCPPEKSDRKRYSVTLLYQLQISVRFQCHL